MSNTIILTQTERAETVFTREVAIPSYYKDSLLSFRYVAIINEKTAVTVSLQQDYTNIVICTPDTLYNIDRMVEVDKMEFFNVHTECMERIKIFNSHLIKSL
ncbi:hypothetical protein SAMN05428988_0109 [Chitinophaga sp. YR573]|uniref:hypothetical protein n=1 Tax=Chitinophaga sp. YR573 TaxID=1881040 RepID=UPI0008D6CCB7|nr:hypothetical protein [Chitinophaga sp. YR573]SEV88466.1 hypothetical protein SAMN05428988_0109 [Chitinophaga sp. YR573]